MVNETYEWLYNRYARPLLDIGEQRTTLEEAVIYSVKNEEPMAVQDKLAVLGDLWGMESFALGLQLGLRLMAGQDPEVLSLTLTL